MRKLYNGYTEEKWQKICTDPYFAGTIKATLDKAEVYMQNPPPQIKFTDYHAYVVTGDRSAFERSYGELNSRVDTFFLAYMFTKEEKYIDFLTNALWNVMDLETWALPAHVSESVTLKKHHTWLELVSSNQGKRLGEILTLMEDKLPELVARRLRNELRERIVLPYIENPDEYWWRRGVSNWSAVCICGVLGGFLYAATEEEIESQLPEMCKTAESFLASFDDQGCCKEGYGYWSYGYSYFCRFADMLRRYTDGKIDYFKNPKVHAIAKFQENVSINDTQCVRFSDCGDRFSPMISLAHFMKDMYPDVQIPSIPAPTGIQGFHDLLWINSELASCTMKPESFTYHDTQWFIHRGPVYNFACKAGYNNEPHNHNDIGSFLISKNNKVTFTDPGGGEYTRQYFGPERYDFVVTSSRGHSVPVINGKYQVSGKVKSTIYADETDRYAFSMENGYNIETLKSLKRDFITNENELLLTDTYEFSEVPESVVERFVTLIEPKLEEGRVTVGDSVLLFDPEVFEMTLNTEGCIRSKTLTETLYMIDLKAKKPEKSFEVSVKFI